MVVSALFEAINEDTTGSTFVSFVSSAFDSLLLDNLTLLIFFTKK